MLHLPGPVLARLDDSGEVEVRDGAWVLDGRITFDRPTSAGRDDVEVLDGWVLPGLVDAHCHVGLGPTGPVDAETARRQAETDRDAGALLLRDAGSPADTRWMDDDDAMPRVLRAGRHVARSRRYLRGVGEEVEPEDLVATVSAQARAGDGWVKVVGDWIDRSTGDLSPCWPVEELTRAVAAAHALGARVAVHTFSEQTLPDLLAAGVDCWEHATGLDGETAAAAAAAGVAITPTLVNTARFLEFAAAGAPKFPTYAAHMRALHARRPQAVRDAVDAGVRLLVGTDAGTEVPHGLVADEVAALVEAGLTPLQALSAATWGSRAYLGAPALEEGAPADLLVLPADPREDVDVLRAPRAVVLRGRAVAT